MVVEHDDERFIPLRFTEVLYEGPDEKVTHAHANTVRGELERRGLEWRITVVRGQKSGRYKLLLSIFPGESNEPGRFRVRVRR